MLKPGKYAIAGASESDGIDKVPEYSSLGLILNAASNALHDAGLGPADIDGITTGYLPVADVAMALGIRPSWADSTVVGGCSWMFQLRNAMAAIEAGYCTKVLITYGESGRSHHHLPLVPDIGTKGSFTSQFDMPYGGMNLQASLFSLPLVRYMHEYGLTEEQLAMVPVVQRKWAMRNKRAKLRTAVTVDEILSSPMIAWPIRRSMCCLVSDIGGAIVLTSAERARDLKKKPVYILGSGAAIETGVASPEGVRDPLHPEFIRTSGQAAFRSAGIGMSDVDHLMIYDAFAHNPIFGLEGLGFVPLGEAGAFIADGNTAPETGSLPMNTNGGGLCYAHGGSYGMLCMLESIRQLRGEADAQIEDLEVSLAHGWGGFWSACSTIIFSNTV